MLLSICIPTYNRAFYLDKLLNSILTQIENVNDVEIVVSDNASTDDTPQVVENYVKKSNKFIYIRNEVNIGADKNFLQVLNNSKGNYLKLVNDYLEFKEGSIALILKYLRESIDKKPIIFFTNGNQFVKHKANNIQVDGLDAFINGVSYFTTWIGGIGFWKDDYGNIINNMTFITQRFLQTELLFECFKYKPNAKIILDKIFHNNEIKQQKIDYNFFDVFLNDYLNNLVNNLKETNRISEKTFRVEKKRMFVHFVFRRYKIFKIKNKQAYDVNLSGMEKTIFNVYKTQLYFYLYALYLPLYFAGFYIKNFFKKQ